MGACWYCFCVLDMEFNLCNYYQIFHIDVIRTFSEIPLDVFSSVYVFWFFYPFSR